LVREKKGRGRKESMGCAQWGPVMIHLVSGGRGIRERPRPYGFEEKVGRGEVKRRGNNLRIEQKVGEHKKRRDSGNKEGENFCVKKTK